MPSCAIKWCKNCTKANKKCQGITFYKNAWLRGNNQEGQVESSAEDIRNVCNELSTRLEYQTARHRLSLRASAVLLSGTARMYRQELDRLYSDCVELEILMIRRRVSHGVSSPGDDQVSGSDGLLETVDEVPTVHEEGVGRNKSVAVGPDESQNSNSTVPENRSKSISSKSYCSNSNCNNSSSRRRTRERGTQTSRSSIRRVSLDQSLPVGVTTVYEGTGGQCFNT